MFNIRVYGLLFSENNEILVSDEKIRGGLYTKFPGGGLEFGEGTRECLKREFMEEMSLLVEVQEHIYTTDFFQMSAFKPTDQIISIYYKVQPLEPIKVPLRSAPFDFDTAQLDLYEKTLNIETFRMIPFHQFSPDDLTLPIDKVVAAIVLGK